MNPERLVAGLDIGSAKTTAIIAEVVGDLPKHPTIKVLGVGQARTTGMRRGVVSDIEETTRSIRKALQDAERMAGAQVQEVYAGIAGEHVQAMTSKGIVAVSDDEINKSDVDRANEVARAQAIPQDRELLHAIPQEYTVDKDTGIRDPIGMSGTRLETEMYLVTIGSSPAINLRKVGRARGLQGARARARAARERARRAHRRREGARRRARRDGRGHDRSRGLPRGEDPPSRHDRLRRQQRDERHRARPRRHAGRRGATQGAVRLRVRAARRSDARSFSCRAPWRRAIARFRASCWRTSSTSAWTRSSISCSATSRRRASPGS